MAVRIWDKEFLNYVRSGHAVLAVKSNEEARILVNFSNQINMDKFKNSENQEESYEIYVWDAVDGLVHYNPSKKASEMPQPDRNRQAKWTLPEGYLESDGHLCKPDGSPAHAGDTIDNPERGQVISLTPGATDSSGIVPKYNRGDGDPMSVLKWLEKAPANSIVFLRDFHTYLKKDYQMSDLVTRKIRNLLLPDRGYLKARGKVLVLVGPTLAIPDELSKDIAVVDFLLPGREELRTVLRETCAAGGPEAKYPDTALEETLLDAAQGMSTNEADDALSKSLVEAGKFDPSIVLREKSMIIKKSNLLEVIHTDLNADSIGGLELLKEDLAVQAKSFTKEAKAFGIKPLKGILLAGYPGCGKSLTAKAIANILGRTLLKMDMGKIFGKYVGESEDNMGSCLHLAEAVAPCVLWIDELEKSMAGNNASNGQEGHETTRRVFQLLLTWMQDKDEDVLIVATANSLDSLPPELLRAGRIDSTWWVDLPDSVQREEILKIHIRKTSTSEFKRDPSKLFQKDDLKQVAKQTVGFSGAELEDLVQKALKRAYIINGHKDLMMQDLLEQAKLINPLSKLDGDKLRTAKAKARERGIQMASIDHDAVAAAESAPVIVPMDHRKVSMGGGASPN